MSESSVAAFKNVKPGDDAPKFQLGEVGGKDSVSLDGYFNKSKAIIVVFWSTWSPRSLKELKDLVKVVEEYGEKGVDVIAVNVEKEEPLIEEFNKMNEIKESLKLNYKMLMDKGLEIFYDYGVVAVPSSVLLDGGGVIRKIYDGYPTSTILDMRTDIEVMLGMQEPEKEIVVVKEVIPEELKKAKLHYGIGRKLVERGMCSKAVRELEESAGLDEKFDLPLVLLGEVYELEYQRVRSKAKKKAKLEKACDAFKRAAQRNNENLFAHSGLVRIYSHQGKLKEADEAVKVILKADSNFVTGIVAHGILLQAKGKDKEAIEEFKRALEYNRNMPKVNYLIAKSYKKINDNKNAVLSLKLSFKQLLTKIQRNMAQEK
jgi:tetratricopeptide (TPR) repeat protein